MTETERCQTLKNEVMQVLLQKGDTSIAGIVIMDIVHEMVCRQTKENKAKFMKKFNSMVKQSKPTY